MPNTQTICTSFKVDLMNGIHAFSAQSAAGGKATADTFKGALYTSASSLGAGTTSYTSAVTELTGVNYTAGGVTITNANTPASSGTTAYWTPSANLTWTSFTSNTTFNALLLYNNTVTGKNAVGVFTFGDQLVTAGNFTLTMPTNDATTGLIRLA